MSGPHQLELRGVHAGYGRIEVLRELDLCVPAGAVVALLGPNGAGKTTTLNAIAGTIRVHKGDVLLEGRSVRDRTSYDRARAGLVLVPEGRGVFPSLTVRENLELVVRGSRCDLETRERRMAEVVDAFPRLAERLSQRAGTMSGGEQQMLALSRAFLASPAVLMMDEISMGLAPKLVEELFEAVQRLRARGTTIVLVEQFVSYALRFADVCYVLNKGRVGFVGEPSELRSGALLEYLSA
jgi:branched-chain amino acid transport system ATP-binding protein